MTASRENGTSMGKQLVSASAGHGKRTRLGASGARAGEMAGGRIAGGRRV